VLLSVDKVEWLGNMARIVKDIVIEGQKVTALFDTGSIRNYVLRRVVEGAPRIKVKPYTVGIGSRVVVVCEECIMRSEIEGLEFTMKAVPLDRIGSVGGCEVRAIIGATAMEE